MTFRQGRAGSLREREATPGHRSGGRAAHDHSRSGLARRSLRLRRAGRRWATGVSGLRCTGEQHSRTTQRAGLVWTDLPAEPRFENRGHRARSGLERPPWHRGGGNIGRPPDRACRATRRLSTRGSKEPTEAGRGLPGAPVRRGEPRVPARPRRSSHSLRPVFVSPCRDRLSRWPREVPGRLPGQSCPLRLAPGEVSGLRYASAVSGGSRLVPDRSAGAATSESPP